MDQNIWGKCTWVLIHSVALNYPTNPSPSEKRNIKTFFNSLGTILPCRYCRNHYQENLKVIPIQCDSKMDLVWWTIDLHNRVNEKTGKRVLSRQEAFQKVMSMYRKTPDNPEGYYSIYIGILILFFFIIFFIQKK